MDNANLATRGKRLAGSIVDSCIMLSIVLPAAWAADIIQQISEGKEMSILQTVVFTLFGWSVFVGLNGHFLNRYGQTIGKRIVGTKIVTLDGKVPPLYNSIVLRYFAFGLIGYIPILGVAIQLADSLFIFRNDKRCLHDHLAETKVVNAEEASKT